MSAAVPVVAQPMAHESKVEPRLELASSARIDEFIDRTVAELLTIFRYYEDLHIEVDRVGDREIHFWLRRGRGEFKILAYKLDESGTQLWVSTGMRGAFMGPSRALPQSDGADGAGDWEIRSVERVNPSNLEAWNTRNPATPVFVAHHRPFAFSSLDLSFFVQQVAEFVMRDFDPAKVLGTLYPEASRATVAYWLGQWGREQRSGHLGLAPRFREPERWRFAGGEVNRLQQFLDWLRGHRVGRIRQLEEQTLRRSFVFGPLTLRPELDKGAGSDRQQSSQTVLALHNDVLADLAHEADSPRRIRLAYHRTREYWSQSLQQAVRSGPRQVIVDFRRASLERRLMYPEDSLVALLEAADANAKSQSWELVFLINTDRFDWLSIYRMIHDRLSEIESVGYHRPPGLTLLADDLAPLTRLRCQRAFH